MSQLLPMMGAMSEKEQPEDLRKALAAAEGRASALETRLNTLEGMVDAISEAIYLLDAEGRFLDVNEGATRLYGYPRSFFIGKTPEVLSAPGRNDLEAVGGYLAQALQGQSVEFEFWGLRKNGEIFPKSVRLYPGQNQGQPVVIAIGQDISARKRAEQTQQATYQIAEAALGSENTQELFAAVHSSIRDLMPADNLFFALWNKGADTVSFPYWVDQVDPAPSPRALRRGLTEFVLRSGAPLLINRDKLLALQAAQEVEAIGTLAMDWLGVPLRGKSGVFGALVIQSYEGGHQYSQEEQDLLRFVSGQVAMAVERSETQQQQRLLTEAMDRSLDAIFGINQEGRFIFVNRAACDALGYDQRTLLALSVWNIDPHIRPEDWPGRWHKIQANGANREETSLQRQDGSLVPVEIHSGLVHFENQTVIFTYARDITERKAAERALRLSEDKFSKVFQASPDAINITGADGAFMDINEAFTRMSGWTREEVLGRTTLDIGIWANLQDRERALGLIKAQGYFTGLDIPFRMKDGCIRHGLISGLVIQVDGAPCMLTVTRDITVQKASEEALWRSERRMRAVLANSQAVIYQLDPQGRFILSEGLALANLGLQPGELVGRSALAVYQDNHAIVAGLQEALQGQASRQIVQQEGRTFDNLLTPVLDDRGKVESVIGIATDITERQLAEDALLAERGLFVGGPVMVIKWRGDPGWPVEYISPNVEAILGYSALDVVDGSIRFADLVHPDDVPRLRRESAEHKAADLQQYEQQYRLRTAAGEYRWFYDFSAAADPGPRSKRFLGYLLDITDRHNAEESLRHSQKLESLGILAGGIAHDFNNLLTVILGNLNLAQMKLGDRSSAQPYLANTEAAVLRATELTKQMLAYSGRGAFQVEARDLNTIVQEVTHLLEVSISKKIRLKFDLEPKLPAIQADGAQLQQVVMNLVTNASDAIGDREGAIHLSTRVVELSESQLLVDFSATPLAPGRFVLLEVEDTGGGMSDEVKSRIFDPFFTTKATGRGLGLSAMLGILKGHGAGLQITSEVGRGSLFRLLFPATDERPQLAAFSPGTPTSKQMRGRVLIVDDEPLILETLASALASFGLQVLTAADGQHALESFRREEGRLDLVIMDMTMPRMDGREAFQAMHEINPAVPVVLSSGYTEQDSMQTFSGHAPAGFIQKPYQITTLRDLLHQVLRG